mmetsp:Transcript_64820/g.173749  ORF Transcript_64820/g.173749 Transcript_64820/m.173749 type:complete len:533 (+) Transcript_64820:59-1657(+)
MAPKQKPRVLVIGCQFSGFLVVRDLHKKFDVTVVDPKEYFEYTPGVLRAYVKPSHFDALTFCIEPVLRKLGVTFIMGEVTKLDGSRKEATVWTRFSDKDDIVSYDYCVICSGCNFNFLHKWGESLWFPTVHEHARPEGSWSHIDERFIDGRRRHILEEHFRIKELNDKGASVLVVGAGFIGVEWATELAYFFPKLKLTICDFLGNCLGPLPPSAADYCNHYMKKVGIKQFYGVKYSANDPSFYETVGFTGGARPDKEYFCMGVKASNYYMPKEVLSDKGPGGGGWIHVNKKLQVVTKERQVWGDGVVFAVGDCNQTFMDEIKPIPKISYPGEEQATHAVRSIRAMAGMSTTYFCTECPVLCGCCGGCCGCLDLCCSSKYPAKKGEPMDSYWPWGAGMFATSLGPHDACFVMGATSTPRTGSLALWGILSAIQKEVIESSKVDECKGGWMGEWIWHFVHHTCCHCFGDGRTTDGCYKCCTPCRMCCTVSCICCVNTKGGKAKSPAEWSGCLWSFYRSFVHRVNRRTGHVEKKD